MSGRVWSAAAAIALLACIACEKSPSAPSTPSAAPGSGAAADARTGVTTASPQPASPDDGAQIKNAAQPLTLVITNGLSASSRTAATYTFEVAPDSSFNNKVYAKDNVPEGGGGRTSLTIDKIGPNRTYYWRVRTNAGSVAGAYSRVRSFAIGPEVILQTPTTLSPAQGATASTPITLTVSNVQRSGPAGPIRYQFDLSSSDSFSSMVFSTVVDEQSGSQTSVSVPASLTSNATYFWRVRATDPANGVTTPFSTTISFKGQTFDFTRAIMHDNPPDVGYWDEGAKITSIDFTPDAILVDFDRRTGSNRWPDTPFGSGDIQYTLGMCLNIGGQWHCSAVVQFWFGRELTASGRPGDIGFQWFYNPARWGPMAGYQPAEGEIVGIFVAAGNLRFNSYNLATCPRVCERSNVALVPFTSFGGASYTFSRGAFAKK